MDTGIGLFRDLVVTGFILAGLFGAGITDEQVAQIGAVTVAAGAFARWAYQAWRNHQSSGDTGQETR